MLKIPNLLFSVIIISIIILFSGNLVLISVYAQNNQYSSNTNQNNNSSLLINELEYVKNILESKVIKLATALQIASSKFYYLTFKYIFYIFEFIY